MLSIDRPLVLALIPAALPALIFAVARFRAAERAVGSFAPSGGARRRRLRLSFFSRLACFLLSWSFAAVAASGVSWGTERVPVQRSGAAVCLVFDISHSMEAEDAHGLSRLEAERQYARALLPLLSGTSVAAVLAKGGGFVAVPLTEDSAALGTIVDSLSPSLLTAAGSSLGKGIDAALGALGARGAASASIWVFTDGDETDGALEGALVRSARRRVPVTFVGFGSEEGAEVAAGGSGRLVRTRLRSEELSALAARVNRSAMLGQDGEAVRFVRADSRSSAHSLLSSLSSSSGGTATEVRPVRRHPLFVALSLAFFALSFVLGELDFRRLARRSAGAAALSLVLSSCSGGGAKMGVLEGAWAFRNGDLRSATAGFYGAAEDESEGEEARNYALFGLASTYIELGELDAAMERLGQISVESDGGVPRNPALAGAVAYNRGVVLARRGDFRAAEECFREAVLADGANVDARVNLELCAREGAAAARGGESELKGVSESRSPELDAKQRAIFNLIRQTEQDRYKNMGGTEENEDVLDY